MQVKLVLSIETKNATANAPVNAPVKISDVLKNVLKNVQKDAPKKLTDRQVNILELIIRTPNITLQEMSKRTKVSVKTIQRDFDAIRKLGISITRKDGKTYGEWVVRS